MTSVVPAGFALQPAPLAALSLNQEVNLFNEHFYRSNYSERFTFIKLVIKESNIMLGYSLSDSEKNKAVFEDIQSMAKKSLSLLHNHIREYIDKHKDFLTSLDPLPVGDSACTAIKAMLEAGLVAGVGPMAAVAGAIAESLGRLLIKHFALSEVFVENGGDIWLSIKKPMTVGIYAGLSSFSNKLGIELEKGNWGIGCSSATVGPALSFGQADAAIAIDKSGALADAWATAIGNATKSRSDPSVGLKSIWAQKNKPLGALVICADLFSAIGCLKLSPL